MAITKEITKVSVKESHGNKAITLMVAVSDNGVQWGTKHFTLDYNSESDIEEEVKKLQEKMQDFINDCVSEINTFSHPKLDDAVTWLNINTFT